MKTNEFIFLFITVNVSRRTIVLHVNTHWLFYWIWYIFLLANGSNTTVINLSIHGHQFTFTDTYRNLTPILVNKHDY